MKQSIRIRLIAWGTTILVLLCVLVVGMRGDLWDFASRRGNFFFGLNGIVNYSDYDDSDYSIGGGSVPAASVDRIHIDWVAGDVLVQPYEGDEITFEETARNPLTGNSRMRWLLDDGTLTLRYLRPGRFGGELTKSLTVRIPREMAVLEELAIDVNSSDVTLSGIKAHIIDCATVAGVIDATDLASTDVLLDTVSGSVTANNLTCDTAFFDTISGDVLLSGTLVSVEGSSVSGTCTIESRVMPKDITVETASGDILLVLPKEPFQARLDAVNGNFETTIAGADVGRDLFRIGVDGPTFRFDTINGDVEIREWEGE